MNQNASQNSVFTVSDSAFAKQNTQLGHTAENVDIQTPAWSVQHFTYKNIGAYCKDYISLQSYHFDIFDIFFVVVDLPPVIILK